MNGLVIIEFIINIRKQMLIHIMPNVVFSLPMSVGFFPVNILKLSVKVVQSAMMIYFVIRLLYSNEGMFHSFMSEKENQKKCPTNKNIFFIIKLIFLSILFHRYYIPLLLFCCFIFPSLVPLMWGETLWNAFFICAIFRYVWTLNMTWLVNSAAHFWGRRP